MKVYSGIFEADILTFRNVASGYAVKAYHSHSGDVKHKILKFWYESM